MKHRSILLWFLAGGLLIAGIFCGDLYRQNIHYKNRNRQLILQNDSILSVNLELINKKQESTASLKTVNE